jgi:NAD(P)-dependent dehydrogenase (short-subunit alcohol dehydrogenase family)
MTETSVAAHRQIRLDDRAAIVTGAARGLGRTMAAGLAAAGARVMLADVDGPALALAVAEIQHQSGADRVAGIAGDITVKEDCERMVAAAIAQFGSLHVLVNNAGKGPRQLELAPGNRSFRFWETDAAVWQEIIVTNVNGTYLMARTAAPHLIASGSGRIVNVTTSLSTMQRRANSPYGVSKVAIEAETLIWAQDLEGTGVTVNSLIPGGAVDTDFLHQAARIALAAEGRALVAPAVMVAPIVWLASRHSDRTTGQRFVGKLWDARLPPDLAAVRSREPSVLLPPPA